MNGDVKSDRQCPINRERQSESPNIRCFLNGSYHVHLSPTLRKRERQRELSFKIISDL